jgi:hypothetical protein
MSCDRKENSSSRFRSALAGTSFRKITGVSRRRVFIYCSKRAELTSLYRALSPERSGFSVFSLFGRV